MMVSCDLRSCSPYLLMSMPSIKMDPLSASMIRNNDIVNDDFPAPVRPTTPTYNNNNDCYCYMQVLTFWPPGM